MDDSRLVFSTDPSRNKKCSKCRELISECTCKKGTAMPGSTISAVLRIEKAGRKGKTVTVVDRLPKIEPFLGNLARKLKARCGAGGTHFIKPTGGVIEIQGDKRDQIRCVLKEEGIAAKG